MAFVSFDLLVDKGVDAHGRSLSGNVEFRFQVAELAEAGRVQTTGRRYDATGALVGEQVALTADDWRISTWPIGVPKQQQWFRHRYAPPFDKLFGDVMVDLDALRAVLEPAAPRAATDEEIVEMIRQVGAENGGALPSSPRVSKLAAARNWTVVKKHVEDICYRHFGKRGRGRWQQNGNGDRF